MIDPRNRLPVKELSNCHLLPAFLGLSNITVKLDRFLDNSIGSKCDRQLHDYLQLHFGQKIEGRISIEGGSKNLRAVLDPSQLSFIFPKPSSTPPDRFFTRALNAETGSIPWNQFSGDAVDCGAAYLSMIHSAFLVFYYLRSVDVFSSTFDWVRSDIDSVLKGTFTPEDFTRVSEHIRIYLLASSANRPSGPIEFNDLRKFHDPTFDPEDGILSEFPHKCVSQIETGWRVTLPYSGAIRAEITFPV